MIYDIIILGGGIAGINTAYQMIKERPSCKILLLEKEGQLGGRIHTYKDRHMTVEAGASRFHSGQKRILGLIKELGLHSNLVKIDSGFTYVSSTSHGDKTDKNSLTDIIRQIKNESKHVTPEKMRNQSFIDFANTVLTEDAVEFIKNSFGYYTELVSMNAYDALYLMTEHLYGKNQFYVLKGGLSQLIDALVKKLTNADTVTILKHRTVSNMNYIITNDVIEISCEGIEKKYYGKILVSALPKQVVEKIPAFRSLRPLLSKIVCGPLCRIYSKYPVNDEGNPWFANLPKITTDNKLRIVIPVNTENGILMSSYSDNKFAKYWRQLHDRDDDNKSVNQKLAQLLRETTQRHVPEPIITHVFYWDCGVGYWGIGANSGEIAKTIEAPFSQPIFICGEHFSEKNQQWIEGALETSDNVVRKIMSL